MKDADFDGIMQGLREAQDHLRGKGVPGMVVHIPADLDVAKIRGRTGLSQPHFAQGIGVSVSTLRNWEQGRRVPEGPARVLLAMLDRNPGIVGEVLGAAGPRSQPRRRPARPRSPTEAPVRPVRSKAQA
jgi:putative transcriptional regulator